MDVIVIKREHDIVRVTGEIDLSNVKLLSSALDDVISRSPKGFVIDLSDATYIDSAGIQALLSAYQHLHSTDGKLALVITDNNIKELLGLLHLDTLPNMIISNDIQSAEEAVSE